MTALVLFIAFNPRSLLRTLQLRRAAAQPGSALRMRYPFASRIILRTSLFDGTCPLETTLPSMTSPGVIMTL